MDMVPEVRGGYFTGEDASIAGRNKPFWAKITGNDGIPTFYSWEEVFTYNTASFSPSVAGRYGTTTVNPCYEANHIPIPDDKYVLMRRAYYDTAMDWIYVAVYFGSSLYPVSEDITWSSNQNNYDLDQLTQWLIVNITGADRTLTGLIPYTTTVTNRTITITNISSSYNLYIAHQSGSSTAEYRIITPDSRTWIITPGGSVQLVYDTTVLRWRVVCCEDITNYYPSYTGLTSWSSNQNNLNISGSSLSYYDITASGSYSLTGIDIGTGTSNGKTIWFTNTSSYLLLINNDSSSSTSTNRIITPDGLDYYFYPGQTVQFRYDTVITKWRIIDYSTQVTYRFYSYFFFVGQDITWSSNKDDYYPGSNYSWWRVTTTSSYNLTGIVPQTSTKNGQLLRITNTGSNNLTIKHQSGSSSSSNQISTMTGGDMIIYPGRTAELSYDDTASKWRIVNTTEPQNTINNLPTISGTSSYTGSAVPTWVKVSKTYTDFTVGGAVGSYKVTCYTTPIKGNIHKVLVHTTTAWTATGLLSAIFDAEVDGSTTSIYVDGMTLNYYDQKIESLGVMGVRSVTATTLVKLVLTVTGTTVDQLTAGAVDLWILVSTLN